MPDKSHELARLLADYPELGAGLDEFVADSTDEVAGLVGVFTLLKLRLHAVVERLPRARADEEAAPGMGGGTAGD